MPGRYDAFSDLVLVLVLRVMDGSESDEMEDLSPRPLAPSGEAAQELDQSISKDKRALPKTVQRCVCSSASMHDLGRTGAMRAAAAAAVGGLGPYFGRLLRPARVAGRHCHVHGPAPSQGLATRPTTSGSPVDSLTFRSYRLCSLFSSARRCRCCRCRCCCSR
jgi:hypothetical protein